MSDETRVIKKYPNRRLYDTVKSRYVTLEDVRKLVLDEVEFKAVDAKTGEDITRSVLLQIILEQEEGGEPILSTPALEKIIRFYGDSLQGMMGSYLENSLQLFVAQQDRFRRQLESMMGDPLSIMRDATEQNLKLWKQMQEGFLRAAGGGRSREPADEDPGGS